MLAPPAHASVSHVSARTAAVALALMLVAVGGYAGVRELTRPAADQRVAPIKVDPDAGEPPEPRRGERKTLRERRAARKRRAERERREARERARRREERERRGGFAPAPVPA